MCDAMLHRGPDDAGIESRGEATIGMRRLAIFDPANGHQPMQTRDGRFTLVFNGAIYNFHALKAELASAGWSFRTNCDTEVLLAAYAQWGESCLGKLRGMFAFAAWDAQQESLFLARDPFGIKPLYYRHDGDRLLFASELNALLAGGVFQAAIDPVSVSEYLAWFAVPAPRTIYRGVFSLRPGSAPRSTGASSTSGRPGASGRSRGRSRPALSHEEFIGELRGRLDDSIRAHTLADVPVGVFLSGGLDSAVIAGLMTQATGARLRPSRSGSTRGSFPRPTEAEATARHFGAEHHSRILTGSEVAADLDRILAAYDQPTGDGINTYYVSRGRPPGGVKVALSGLGGDELFGGYPSFKQPAPDLALAARCGGACPRPSGIPSSPACGGATPGRGSSRTSSGTPTTSTSWPRCSAGSSPSPAAARSCSPETLEAVSRADRPSIRSCRLSGRTCRTPATFEIASAWELRTYMADLLLRDSDVMSMRHSLELRVPFVDRPLIEWLWRQPTDFKYTPAHPKDALAEAAADMLPPDMRERGESADSPCPSPFGCAGSCKPFLDETFSDSSVDRAASSSARAVQSLWRNFLHDATTADWSRVWSLAVLIAFVNRRLPAPAVRPAPDIRPPGRRTCRAPMPARRRRPTRRSAEGSSGVTLLDGPGDLLLGRGNPADPPALPQGPLRTRPRRRTTASGWSRSTTRCWIRATCGATRTPTPGQLVSSATGTSAGSSGNPSGWPSGCDRLICGHVAQLPVAWMAKLLRPRLKYYLVAHGIEVWRQFKLTERIALRGAERILCVSDYTRTRAAQALPGPQPERVVVLPNALDPVFAIENGTPLAECPPTVLTVTRLTYNDRYKGVETSSRRCLPSGPRFRTPACGSSAEATTFPGCRASPGSTGSSARAWNSSGTSTTGASTRSSGPAGSSPCRARRRASGSSSSRPWPTAGPAWAPGPAAFPR